MKRPKGERLPRPRVPARLTERLRSLGLGKVEHFVERESRQLENTKSIRFANVWALYVRVGVHLVRVPGYDQLDVEGIVGVVTSKIREAA